ncbi:hypothetical protein [Micromonospora sp. NPDC047738]|uniref:hypothetical protein n=1 Tax=unclassified Micromonospora TaxID=2617518 RepID=UPI0033D3CD80
MEGRFEETIRVDQGYVLWQPGCWPEVPSLGLGREFKYAHVQLVFNASDIWATEPSAGHSVFVHVRHRELERAEWLARQAGLSVIGPGGLGR